MIKSDVQRECELLEVNEDSQVAKIRVILAGDRIEMGVNLWEVKGYSRKWDGFSVERFIPQEVLIKS